jgi:cytochrome c peroxidase
VLNSPNLDPLILNGTNTLGNPRLQLTALEKDQIVAFLQTLTDTTFTHDRRYSKP